VYRLAFAFLVLAALCACAPRATERRSAQPVQPAGPSAQPAFPVSPSTVTETDAIERAAACVGFGAYECESSTLTTVSPYGATPRTVWDIRLQNRSPGRRVLDHAIVWVDAATGEAEHIPCN
jgi:hypothetical protein